LTTFDAHDKDELVKGSGDPSVPGKLAALAEAERKFYRRIGISTAYHDAFYRYTGARRKRSAAGIAAGTDCSAVDYWLLHRKDMENMDISVRNKSLLPPRLTALEGAKSRPPGLKG
jgi:hypothetical protein